MRMGRTSVWRSAAVAAALLGAAACAENITTPGRCPDYCPADTLLLVDTVLTGIVVADTSIRGYNEVSSLEFLLAGDQDSLRTLAYVRLQAMPQQWVTGVDTVLVGTIDSVAIDLQLNGRDSAAKNLRLLAYQAPVTLDSTTAIFDSLAIYAGGPLLDSVPVSDSTLSGGLRHLVPVAAFTPQAADSFRLGLVLDARGTLPTTVTIASNQTGSPVRLTYYVHGAAPKDTFQTNLQVVPDFDTYARNPEPPLGTTTGIIVGDQPASRAFVHFQLPAYIQDSVTVLRATLALRLRRAAAGRPGEKFAVQASPVLRYFGGKSIIIADTTVSGVGTFTAGDTGTVAIEMARVLRLWHGVSSDSLPRVVQMANRFEFFSLGGIDALGSAGGADAPRLFVTYIRPITLGVP
jgi:hypothetical protein